MASAPSEAPDRTYYALLGVPETATDDQIKRAYRQLATTLHPDKVPDAAHHDEAATLFTRIQEAYEVGAGRVHVLEMPGVHCMALKQASGRAEDARRAASLSGTAASACDAICALRLPPHASRC